MARHSAAQSPVRVAEWVWFALVAVILVVALVVGWFVLASRQATEKTEATCIDGEQELTVWADPAAEDVAQRLVDGYNETDPVVRDRCVTASVEVRSTAEATLAYRGGQPGVAPVWIPAGTGFISGLSGAPTEVPVVGSDELIHRVPEGADADVARAMLPTGAASMVTALAAEAAGVPLDMESDATLEALRAAPDVQSTVDENLPVLSSASLLGEQSEGNETTVGEVQFPLVAFGSSPAVDENQARAAADLAEKATAEDTEAAGETVTTEPASPWLSRVAGVLADVPLG